MDRHYKLGLRAFKSAISVFFCLLIAIIFNRPQPLLASIAAIICMQPTYNETYKTGLHRLVGTSIGGVIGLIFLILVRFIPYKDNLQYINLLLAPICILVVIYICNVIGHKSSVSIGCIVVLSVLVEWSDSAYSNTFMYVINRVIDTSIGIVIAMIVNKFFFKKHSKIDKTEKQKNNNREEIIWK